MKVFVYGSINMDLVIESPRLPKEGETISGHSFYTNPGGKGANQAVALAKAQTKTYMVGRVGDAFGDELISTLSKYGVDTTFVKKEEKVSSGLAVIIVQNGENSIILDAGSNGFVGKEDIDKALEIAEPGDFIISQLEIPLESIMYAFKKAKEKGLYTFLNPAPAKELDKELFKYVDFFAPNQTETELFTGIYPADFEKAKEASAVLHSMGIGNVIITMGGEGSVFFSKDGIEHKQKRYPATVVDTTAAGDTFCGSFVSEFLNTKDPIKAMDYASRASSLTIAKKGAQQSIPQRSEVEQVK